MASETTHPSLLVRVRNPADEASWNEFEAKYRDLIARYCRRRGLQPSDCDDVQQLVWLHLAKGMRSFEYDSARGRFRDYLGRVARNAIYRHLARPKQADRALDSAVLATTPDEDDSGADAHWDEEWVSHHYRLALGKLRATFEPRSVAVFERLLAGDSVNVAADSFGMTTQAVHKVKQRIQARMRALITQQLRDEDESAWPADMQ